MADKIAEKIVKFRWLIVVFFVLATAVCITTVDNVTINYDFTKYLSEDTITSKSLKMMKNEFGYTEQLTVMLISPKDGEARALCESLDSRDGVLKASYDPDTDRKVVDGIAHERVSCVLDCEDSLSFTENLQKELEARTDFCEFVLSGAGAQTLEIQDNIAAEVPIALLIAVLVVIAVLFLTSHSYIEPLIFLIVLAVSIVVNMGTNFVFPSISFVTFAVTAILQLALAMDYSIMLLHNFIDLRDTGLDDRSALVKALARSFMPIASSSLTTVAGMCALMFMSFTIGFDIGIVLAKGIIISMLTVFTFMPAMILVFAKTLRRTMHKPLPLGGKYIGRMAVKMKRALPIALILIIIASAYAQSKNEYSFSDAGTDMKSKLVSDVFGESNQLVLLIPKGETDADYDLQRKLVSRLTDIRIGGKQAVTQVMSMVTTGEMALTYLSPADLQNMLEEQNMLTDENINAMLEALPNIGGNSGINLGGEFAKIMLTSMVKSGTFGDYIFSMLGLEGSVRADKLIEAASEKIPDNPLTEELVNTLELARSMFMGESLSRMILIMDIPLMGTEANKPLEEIMAILNELYPNEQTGIAGLSMSSYDISSAFGTDILRVSIITIIAILLIIAISFRSLSIPVILVSVIQGAIWITMAVSVIKGERIFFMCYLICVAIQMGATIDYGILLAGNYKRLRTTLNRNEAIERAVELSLPTIFTSGIILIVAGFAVGNVCTVYYIYSIGRMLARGAAISVFLVLVLLPALLLVADRLIHKNKARKETAE